MALGAHRGDIGRMVLAEGVGLVAMGVLLGAIAALAVAHVMAGLVFGVGAYDPLTFAGVAVLISAVALTACHLSARRAAKVDPLVALRCE